MLKHKWIRRLALGFVAVVGLVVVIFSGAYVWLRQSLPDYDGMVRVANLTDRVSVVRDGHGVPHIFAENDADALFALGYVHAQDRLWQMETLRRIGQGRLSEVAGAATLGLDKMTRTLGFYRQAQDIANNLPSDVATGFQAYADGVNAFLESGPSLPVEFVAAGIEPDPWTPADSIVWGKVMTLQLSGNWFSERLRLLLSSKLSPDQIADLWPGPGADGPNTLADLAPLHRQVAALAGDGARPAGLPAPGFSNEWVVDGQHTVTGKPLLANDPHLGYQAPNLWYLARIETPNLTLTGATIPGVPLLVLGHNGHIAWGLTTTHADTADLFIERLTGDESYETENGPKSFETRTETIGVKDGADVDWPVRETRHGPVVSDLWQDQELPLDPGHVLALSATFLDDLDTTAATLYRINRARSVADFRAIIDGYGAPQQNFVVADTAGHIGFIAAGKAPIRPQGDGFMPVPGWTGGYDWTGTIPTDELPQAFDPPGGILLNANNDITPPGYPYVLGREWENRYRAERLADLLAETGPFDAVDFADFQNDPLSLAAQDLLPLMLAAAPLGDRAADAHARLARWDGHMVGERVAPTLFLAWLGELNRALYADELGDLFDRYWGLRPVVVKRMLTERQIWCDDVTTANVTEDCTQRLQISLARAIDGLAAQYGPSAEKWRWDQVHPAIFRNRALDGVPFVGDLAGLALPVDGGPFTLLRNSVDIRSDSTPFAAVHGAGYRAIYDLADLDQSLFIQATGQSGHFLSTFYGNLLDFWQQGRYIRLSGSRNTVAAKAIGTLDLVPLHVTLPPDS